MLIVSKKTVRCKILIRYRETKYRNRYFLTPLVEQIKRKSQVHTVEPFNTEAPRRPPLHQGVWLSFYLNVT